MTEATFIEKSKETHYNKYGYDNCQFMSLTSPVYITCTIHGRFKVGRAEKHPQGQGCPTCAKANISSYELKLKNALDHSNISYIREATFDDCISPLTNRKLKFDFFLPELNILIEFDGDHHTQQVPHFNKTGYTLEKCKVHDKTKEAFAQDHNFILLRITKNTILSFLTQDPIFKK